MEKDFIKRILKDTFPVLAGYFVLGVGFGIIMRLNGYGVLWTAAMSLFIYAGSMQYAAVGLITGGASFLTFAVTTLAVNARHLFYGISMIDKYKNARGYKPYLIFALTDETYSLVSDGSKGIKYDFFVSLFDHFYWVMSGIIGSLIGNVIKFNTAGVEFSLTALFVTVFTDWWISGKDRVSAVCGVVSTVLCRLIFGKENFLIPSMVLIFVLLIIKMKREDKYAKR